MPLCSCNMYKDVGRFQPGQEVKKASAENVNDHCRLCNWALKLKYEETEKMTYISTENLFKPSRQKEYLVAKPLSNYVHFI